MSYNNNNESSDSSIVHKDWNVSGCNVSTWSQVDEEHLPVSSTGSNPGGGSSTGSNPGGGSSTGSNPGGGSSTGSNPGGGSSTGSNPGGGVFDPKTSPRRLLRSGSTFGGMSLSDVDPKRPRQTTPSRRHPGVRTDSDDNRQWVDVAQVVTNRIIRSLDDSEEESDEQMSSSSCGIDTVCCFSNGSLAQISTHQTDVLHSDKERQSKEETLSVLKHDQKQTSNRDKDTPRKLKLSHAGNDGDGQQGQNKAKVKSDHLMSLLRLAEVQHSASSVVTVASSVSLSLSSSSSSSSSLSMSLPAANTSAATERRKERDNSMSLKSPAVGCIKNKASLLTHQSTAQKNVDFTQVQPVPDETFFVSLSKDKNKELSMLATAKGTVRVNSAVSKKHSEGLPSTAFFKDSAKPHRQHDTKKKDGDKNSLKSVLSPNLKINSLSRSNSLNKDTAKVDRKGSVFRREDGPKSHLPDSAVSKIKDNKSFGDNLNAKLIPHSVTGVNDPDLGVAVSILKTNDGAIRKSSKSNELHIDSSEKHAKDLRKTNLKPVSQYPLMEGILTCQPHLSVDKKEMRKVCESSGSSPVFKHPSNAIGPPTLLSEDAAVSSSKHIKRSERIRCKSAVENELVTHSVSRQGVISTMKPINKKSKSKIFTSKRLILKKSSKSEEKRPHSTSTITPGLASSSSSMSSSSFNRKKELVLPPLSKKKKNNKGSGGCFMDDVPEKKVTKKGKDFSKAKACMSREVMDGIVKSIEETVSRVHESTDEDSRDSASSYRDESVQETKKTVGTNANAGDGLVALDSKVSSSDAMNSLRVSNEDINTKVSLKGMPVAKRKTSNSKLYKSKSMKSARIRAMHKSKLDGFLGTKGCRSERPGATDDDDDYDYDENEARGSSKADSLVTTGKRFRKKTRKAEEALGDYDILWDEEWPVKKTKAKKRSSQANNPSSLHDPSAKVGQRRSRRGLEHETISSDPVLEEHAFILWASEHRSELELKFPNVSTSELDALLSAKWCDVTAVLKTKYFSRAKEAFSDDDRQRIWSNHSSYGDLDSDVLCGFILDRDPVFSEFVRMPVHRQRDLLRKWLKFFQKMMPRKEYVEFMVSFKRACGRDDIVTKSGKPKRTRIRSLDPAHYKMLFDLIRLSKPRVLEVYKERRGKEKTMISNTYSLMLKHLVNNQSWPHMDPDCQSRLLTELFHDLDELDREMEERKRQGEEVVVEAKVEEEEEGNAGLQVVPTIETALPLQAIACRDNDHSCYYRQPGMVIDGMEVDGSWGGVYDLNDVLDDDDLALLDTSFAQSCLSELEELSELPVLSQQVLDEVFMSPAVCGFSSQIKLNQSNNNIYNDFIDNGRVMKIHCSAPLKEPPFSPAPHQNVVFRSSGSIPFPDTCMNPVNIHYRSSVVSTPGRFLQTPPSLPYPTTIVSYKGNQCQPREGRLVKPRSMRGKSESIPKPLVGYGGAIDNLLRHPSHTVDPGSSMRCIRVRSSRHSSSTQQIKMPFHPYQLPIGVHRNSSLPRHAPQTMSLTSSNAYNNKFPVEMSYRPRVFNSSTHSIDNPTKCVPPPGHFFHHRSGNSRSHSLHHHGTSSPLITSLSSLRTIKSRTSQQVPQACQMIPCCRSKLLCSSCSHQGGNSGYRRNMHSLPICASSKLSGTCSQNNSLQPPIKVCLPSQALKIPIAKLKGSRKTATSYVKNRMKTPTVSFCNNDLRFEQATPHFTHDPMARPTSSENQSVLARVLSFQGNEENEPPRSSSSGGFYSSMSTARSSPCIRSFMSPLRQVKDNMSIISTESRIDSKVQLVSIIGNNNNNKARYNCSNSTIRSTATSNSGSSTSLAIPPPRFRTSSPQKAIVVNPLHLHRCPGMSRFGNGHGKLNVVRTAVKTTPMVLTAQCENPPLTYLTASTQSDGQAALNLKENVGTTLVTAIQASIVVDKEAHLGHATNVLSSCVTEPFDNMLLSNLQSSQESETGLTLAVTSSTSQTSVGVSASRSVPLLSPSHSLSHLLSTDSSVPEGTERCACTACLSFNKKKMSHQEAPLRSKESKEKSHPVGDVSIGSNNGTTPCDNKTVGGELTPAVASSPDVFGGSKFVPSFDQGDDANDSDDNKDIKSFSLHDAWGIATVCNNSVTTQTTHQAVRVSTPEMIHSHSSQHLPSLPSTSCRTVSTASPTSSPLRQENI